MGIIVDLLSKPEIYKLLCKTQLWVKFMIYYSVIYVLEMFFKISLKFI